MTIKPRDVYTARYYRHGASYGFIVPPDIRELMHLTVGDMFAMILRDGILIVAKVTPEMLVNRDTVSRIFDEIFPDKAEANGSR